MAVQDDLRRLSELDSIFLGQMVNLPGGLVNSITSWHRGRVQQANDGTWIFRSLSFEGTIVGFQLGPLQPTWASSETPSFGIQVPFQLSNP
jgi:hypothetical protein